jgi:hypothetical protein
MGVRVAVPEDLAASLLKDGLAVRPLDSRSEAGQVATAVVEIVGAAANLVTIVVAVPAVREMLKRSVRPQISQGPATMADPAIVPAVTVQFSGGEARPLRADAPESELESLAREMVTRSGDHSAH